MIILANRLGNLRKGCGLDIEEQVKAGMPDAERMAKTLWVRDELDRLMAALPPHLEGQRAVQAVQRQANILQARLNGIIPGSGRYLRKYHIQQLSADLLKILQEAQERMQNN